MSLNPLDWAFIKYIRNRLFLVTGALLVIAGLLVYFQFAIAENPVNGLILLNISVFSIAFLAYPFWKRTTPYVAPFVIWFATQHFIGKKILTGGSFSYFEYREDPSAIPPVAPLSRLIAMLIAFLGLSTSIIKAGSSIDSRIQPVGPTESIDAVIGWSFLILIVPLILTPIIPVVWSMEDLRLKTWNKKKGVNWRVADKYRRRFNSFIAVGAVTAGLALSPDQTPGVEGLIIRATDFGFLLLDAAIVLLFPLSVLTLLYYWSFRGEITEKVRKKLDIPVIMTELIYDVRKYKQMESKLEQYEKEVEDLTKKVEKSKKGRPRIWPFGSSQQVAEDEEEVVGSENIEVEEEEETNPLLSKDRVTEDNYAEMEEKYFGTSSGTQLSRKSSKPKAKVEEPTTAKKIVQAPVKVAEKGVEGVNKLFKNTVGKLGRKDTSKKADKEE